MSQKANNPMFEKTALTILIQSKGGYRETSVHEMDGELYLKNGSYFLRIKQDGATSNSSITWIKFSNGMVPQFNTIGWAMGGGRWRKAKARTLIKNAYKR